jgi:hypothetical protein
MGRTLPEPFAGRRYTTRREPHAPLGRSAAAGRRHLRIVLLPDGETVRNAFFDRGYEP